MTGPLYQAIEALSAQIAAAPAFVAQCALSEYQPNDATKHIFLDEARFENPAYDTDLDKQRPFVVIIEDSDAFMQVSQGVGVGMVGGGNLQVLFCDKARETDDPDEPNASKLDFVSWVSETLLWISQNNGIGDYRMPWHSINQVEGYMRSDLQDRAQEDYWTAVYSFSYGVPNA